jgi:ribonuclease-3
MEKTNYTNDGFIVNTPDGNDEIIHIPYNLNNILISEQDIMQILNQYNVKVDCIKRIEYFIQAFTHKSYCKKDILPSNILELARNELGNPSQLLELFDKSYERLEYFGDRVLKVIVSMYLFHRYPKQDEGFMTRLQTKLEDKKNLAIMSKEIGLGKYFIISKQIELTNGRNLDKIHEDIFESFVGALFLSNGFEPCMFLIVNLLETLIDYSEKLYCDNNYKDQLLRIHHQNKWTFPQYITIHYEGPPHKRKYIMGVEKQKISKSDTIHTRCISYGIGSSKKEGEQNAAKMALIIHGVLNKDQYSQSDIYYPPWSKIDTFDGETMIIKINEPDTETNNEEKLAENIIQEKLAENIIQEKLAENIIQEKLAENIIEEKLAENIIQEKLAENIIEEKLAENIIQEKLAENIIQEKLAENIIQEKLVDKSGKIKKEKMVKPKKKVVKEKVVKEKVVKEKVVKSTKLKVDKEIVVKPIKSYKIKIDEYDSDNSDNSDNSVYSEKSV